MRDFSITYRDPRGQEVKAVDRVDLELPRGRALGLFGESGCGKSSLVLGAFGLAPRAASLSGQVLLNGRRLDGLEEKHWSTIRGRQVGLVFQQPALALHPLRTIGGQLKDVLRTHSDLDRAAIHRRCLEWIGELELEPEHLGARPYQLSGGQQQRALLALALAAEPRLLVADEPTAALDEETEDAVLDLVRGLRKKHGLSLLWISHDPRVLEALCDDIAVMQAGRVVEIGEASRVLGDPRHSHTRELLSYRLERPR